MPVSDGEYVGPAALGARAGVTCHPGFAPPPDAGSVQCGEDKQFTPTPRCDPIPGCALHRVAAGA